MFTVLIAEKKHIDAIQQKNKLFFEPFLESKELAFCEWNPMGQNLSDSVPGLLDAVGRRKEWRAVIINNCTSESFKFQNPFDIVDHRALDALRAPSLQPDEGESIEKWEETWKNYYSTLTGEKETVYKSALTYPLQKLSTWLCYKPEDYIHNEVHDKQDAQSWALEKLGRDEVKPSVKLELLEREQYKRELRLKENIRRAFAEDKCLNINYPSEIACISPRAAGKNYFDPDAYWNMHQDSEYSTFADRNMYFDKMRFVVFDLLAPSHRNFRSDYVRFLASVLIFISNPIPSSAMQARHLYCLDVEADDAPLCTLVASYDKKLSSTNDVIESEIEKIKSEIPSELTDKAAEDLFCSQKDVAVLLDDSCDFDKVYAEKDYGLFFDTPENEHYKWNRDYNTSQKELAYITKQQSRSIRKSVNHMHLASEVSDTNISRLTPYQIDDVRDYTNKAEDIMISSTPSDLADTTFYTKRMDEASEKVKKTINRRMTRKAGLILCVVCLALYLICFLPFLFSNHGSFQTVSAAIVLIAGSLGVLTLVLVISLFVMRSSVVNAVKNYNNTAREVINDIDLSMKQFSKYLSALCNVRRGYSVQNYAQKNVDVYTRSLRVRKKHQEDIKKRRAHLAENYSDYLEDRSYCDEIMSRPYDYDFDQMTEYTYPAPFMAGDHRQIEFIRSGNFVTVPSSFITKMLVRMEEIYER